MKSLYFIAFVLPDPLHSQVHSLKLSLKQKYGLSHALNSPPHITLIPPFLFVDEGELSERLHRSAGTRSPFLLKVSGYDSFLRRGRPPVLYLKPILPALEEWRSFHSDFLRVWGGTGKHPFIPHITLAHRDLTPEIHEKIIQELPPISGSALLEKVSLLRHEPQHKVWEIVREASMTGE